MFYKHDKVNDDFFTNDDYFNGKEYAKDIIDALKNDDIKSIGLYGKWGIGKTSIIKNALKQATSDGIYQQENIIEYNAWKYNKYDFMRDFLIECSYRLEGEEKAKKREFSYYNDRTEETHISKMLWKTFIQFIKSSWCFFLFVVLMFVAVGIVIVYINNAYPNLYECEDILVPLVIALIGFILPIFVVSDVSYKNISKKFSPEQFSRDFDKITHGKKILIFIDDIDRCDCNEIKETFDILKTFILSKNNNIKFIIPIDPNVLYSTLGDNTYDYFSKIIDYPIIIKKYEKISFENLKRSVMEDVDKEYKNIANDGIYLASKYYIDTPRKFKKFTNQFINEIYKYNPKQIRKKGAMFAKLIILKNEFPIYYDSLVNNYNKTQEITSTEINKYESSELSDTDITVKGVKFNKKLLEFLSKTTAVDLYDFSLFESDLSYEKYRIKLICEEPIDRNRFEDDIRINLGQNQDILKYELMNNIIIPINTGQFLYRDILNKICFILNQFDNQVNSKSARKIMENIKLDKIKNDRMIIQNFSDTIKINWEYILGCLDVYNLKISKLYNDFIISWLIDFINDNFSLITDYNQLLKFISYFEKEKQIENPNLTRLIELLLYNGFNEYAPKLLWYFNYSHKKVSEEFIEYIIRYMANNNDANTFKTYITSRYGKANNNKLINKISEQIELLIEKSSVFSWVIEHATNTFNPSKNDFDVLCSIINRIGINSDNLIMNNFIYAIIKKMKKTKKFDSRQFNNILKEFGKSYGKNITIEMIQDIVDHATISECNCILGYNEEKNIYEYSNIIFDSVKLPNSISIFEIYINTFNNLDRIPYKENLDGNGFDLMSFSTTEISRLINIDMNRYIYLVSEFDYNVKGLHISELAIEDFDYNRLSNRYLKIELIDNVTFSIKQIADEIIMTTDIYKIKELNEQLISYLNILIIKMDYSSKEIWRTIKQVEREFERKEMLESIYITELNKYDKLKFAMLDNTEYKNRNKNYNQVKECVKQ